MDTTSSSVWIHDAAHIRRLQHAHADHIESLYTGLAQIPGNPDHIRMDSFGATRTFLASGERFTNRIILSGNETPAELATLFAYYDEHQAGCVLEVNPANFYSSNPFSGDSALVPILLANGCELCEFRCVWYRTCETAHATAEALPSVRIFDETDIDDYIALSKQVESEQDWQAHEIAIRTAAAQMGWYYFVAFEQDKPIATASLYQTGSLGYLAQAYTHLDHRRRGAHARLIQARVQHAHALGCHGVFSVTDSHTQSARDLQRMNFILAYNYLLFVRSPIPNKL